MLEDSIRIVSGLILGLAFFSDAIPKKPIALATHCGWVMPEAQKTRSVGVQPTCGEAPGRMPGPPVAQAFCIHP